MTASVGDFQHAASSAFGFLVREYGYKQTEAEHWRAGGGARPEAIAKSPAAPLGAAHVRFESKRAALDVWHDPRAEVSVVLTRGRDESMSFDLEHLLRFLGAAGEFGGPYGGASVGAVLDGIAASVRAHAGPWLRGEERPWLELATFVRVEAALTAERYAGGRRSPAHLKRLDEAWRARDYRALADHLRRLPGGLSEAEELALVYAKAQLARRT